MRMSTVLMALLIGAVLYVMLGIPATESLWKDDAVTDKEKAAIAHFVLKKDRDAVRAAAQWSVAPMSWGKEGNKVRVVRMVSKPEPPARAYDRLFIFDTQGSLKFRRENTFGDQWKRNLQNTKANDWIETIVPD